MAVLGVTVVETDGDLLTYTADPPIIDCGDLGMPINLSVMITVSDVDGSDDCNINIVDVLDGGPFADCMDYTANIVGTMATVTPADIDAGSSACSGIATYEISKDGMAYGPSIMYDCNDVAPATNIAFLRVTDVMGAMAVCTATITVEDNTIPTITCVAGTQTRNTDPATCTYTAILTEFDPLAFSDNCSGVITNSVNGTATLAGEVFSEGTVTVTWTVTDPSSNTATCSFDVTVNDNQAPVITCPTPVTQTADAGLCSAVVSFAANLATETDNCSATITNDYNGGGADASDTYPVGTTMVTFTASDGTNMVTCSINVIITDDEDPVITCPTPVTQTADPGVCEAVVNFSANLASATDNCLGVSISNDYNGGGDDATDTYPLGTTTVTFTATDASTNTTTCSIVVTITDDEPPVITNCPPSSAVLDVISAVTNTGTCATTVGWINPSTADACNGIASFTTTATDPDGNPIVITVGSAPPTPPCTNISLFAGYYDASLWTITGTVNISGAPPEVIVEEGASFARTVEYDGVISFDWDRSGGAGFFGYSLNGNSVLLSSFGPLNTDGSVEVPVSAGDGFTFFQGGGPVSPETSITNFAFTCAAGAYGDFPEGVSTVTYEATDNEGNTATCTFYVEVVDGEPPVAVCQDITVQLDASGNASILATDVDGGSTDNCAIDTRTLSNSTFDCDSVGTRTVELYVADIEGNVDTCTATVTVEDNVAPTAVCQNITVQLDATGNVTITPAQIDNGSSDACGIMTLALDQTAFDCSHVGNNLVTLTVTDNNGNVSTCNAQVTVEDVTNPTALCQNITVQLDATGNASIAAADIDGGSTDACGIASLAASPNTFNCSNVGANTVTLTVTDNNGNTATCSATVTVEDNVSPTVTCQALTVQLDGSGNASIVATDLVNASSDNCGVASTSADVTSFTCADVGPNTVTVTVTDVNGNTSTCTSIVTVEDNVVPSITCPSNLTRDASATCDYVAVGTEFDATSSGNCSTTVSNSFNGGATLAGATFPLGNTNVVWTASDMSGNTVTCNITVVVEDNTDPVLTVPSDINVSTDAGTCDAVVTFATSATDNCDASVDILCVPVSGSTFPLGTTTVTCTATDDAGNVTVSTFDVRVDDMEAPTAICQDLTVQLDASGSATINTADIDNGSSDNCSAVTLAFGGGGPGPFCDMAQGTPGFSSDPACEAAICALDPFCCSVEWDGICAGDAANEPACAGCLAPPPSSNTLTFDCTQLGTNIVTLGVTDATGNTSTCTATVTVEDNIPPSITCPADVTASAVGACEASVTVPAPVINDNCTATAVNNFNGTADASGTYPTGTTPVTWTVTDGSGNTSICTMNVIVEDNEAPLLTCPVGSQIINDVASGSMAGLPLTISEDVCDILAPSFSESIVVSGIPAIATIDDVEISLDITHFWIGDLTIHLVSPMGTTIELFTRPGTTDPSCSTFSSFGCAGDNIFATFTDNASAFAESQCNGAFPSMSGDLLPVNGFATSLAGEDLNGIWTLLITDAFDDNFPGSINAANINIDYSFSAPSSNIERLTDPGVCDYTTVGNEFDPAAFSDGCPGVTIAHNYPLAPNTNTLDGAVFPVGQTNITWTATDASGNTTVCNIAIIVTDDVAPIQTSGIADGTVIDSTAMGGGCTATVNWIAPTFVDNCLNPVVPTSTHTPGSTFSVGTHFVEYTATDPSGNVTVVSFTVEVTDGVPPVAGCQPNPINIALDGSGVATLTALDVNLGSFDNCAIDSYLISVNGGATFVPSYGFVCSELGTYNVILRISDGVLTDDCSATVIVSDLTPPVAMCQSATVNLDANGEGTLNLQQVDGGSTDNGFACLGYALDNSDFDCGDIGLNIVTLTVTDAGGNTSTCTSIVNVVDVIPPVLIDIPADVTVHCDSIPAVSTMVSAFDTCGIQGINFNESNDQVGNAASCGDYNYTITREWTATDAGGNTSVGTQTITVIDNVAPMFAADLPGSVSVSANQINCSGSVTLFVTSADYSDNCAPNNVLSLTNDSPVGNGTNDASGVYPTGATTVNFFSTDPCGNVGTYTVVVNVIDDIAPVALCAPTTIGIPAGVDSVIILPQYIDNGSFDNCVTLGPANFTVTPSSFDCSMLGVQTVTLTVFDGVQSSSCATTITIQDLNPPVAQCLNIDVSLEADGTASITAADVTLTAFDACSGVESTSIDISTFDIDDLGPNDVELTVIDSSGNVATCTAVVNIIPPPTCFDVGAAVGGAGNIIQIPVDVTDFTAVGGFQFSLNIFSDNAMEDRAEFIGVSGPHPNLMPAGNLVTSITHDSLPTNDTLVHVQYGDILDGMGDPYDGVLDTIDVEAVLDTLLFANTINISWFGDPSVSINDDETVFFLDVLLTGDIGEVGIIGNIPNVDNTPAEILFDFGGGNFIEEEPCFFNGGFQINELIIAGQIMTEPAATCELPLPNVPAPEPIALVDVELYDIVPVIPTLEDTYTTMADGLYEFTINGAGDFEVIPNKDINWGNQSGALTSFDVQRIQAHAVGASQLCTAYKKIAADVNDDGKITTIDAALLNFFVLNNVPPLPTPPDPPNQSWRFVDAKQVLPNVFDANVPPFDETIVFMNLISDTTDNDFIGVKIGDINNSSDAQQFTGGGGGNQGDDRTGSLEFVVEHATTKAGESMALDFTARSFNDLVAYQWILEFDPEVLDFEGVTAQALANLSENNVGVKALEYGLISFTWYSVYPVTHEESDILFTLNFNGLKDGVELSDILSVKEFNVFPTEAYANNAEIRDIELTFADKLEDGEVVFELFQNQPNPFKDETSIRFNLPEATSATLTISDATGRTLKVIEGDYTKGYNEISIDRTSLSATGVLYYQLETSEHSATRKMIVVE